MTLREKRLETDEIDRKIVALLNDRAECVRQIGMIKGELKMELRDPEREREVIDNVQKHNRGSITNGSVIRIFEVVMQECLNLQEETRAKGGIL